MGDGVRSDLVACCMHIFYLTGCQMPVFSLQAKGLPSIKLSDKASDNRDDCMEAVFFQNRYGEPVDTFIPVWRAVQVQDRADPGKLLFGSRGNRDSLSGFQIHRDGWWSGRIRSPARLYGMQARVYHILSSNNSRMSYASRLCALASC